MAKKQKSRQKTQKLKESPAIAPFEVNFINIKEEPHWEEFEEFPIEPVASPQKQIFEEAPKESIETPQERKKRLARISSQKYRNNKSKAKQISESTQALIKAPIIKQEPTFSPEAVKDENDTIVEKRQRNAAKRKLNREKTTEISKTSNESLDLDGSTLGSTQNVASFETVKCEPFSEPEEQEVNGGHDNLIDCDDMSLLEEIEPVTKRPRRNQKPSKPSRTNKKAKLRKTEAADKNPKLKNDKAKKRKSRKSVREPKTPKQPSLQPPRTKSPENETKLERRRRLERERKAFYRKNLSDEKIKEEREKDKLRKREHRAMEKNEETELRRAKDALKRRMTIKMETPEQRATRRAKEAMRQRMKRQELSAKAGIRMISDAFRKQDKRLKTPATPPDPSNYQKVKLSLEKDIIEQILSYSQIVTESVDVLIGQKNGRNEYKYEIKQK